MALRMLMPVLTCFHTQQIQTEGYKDFRCLALDARSSHRLELVVVIPELEPLGLEPRALRHEA